MEFLRAFGGVFSLIIVVMLGWYLARKGWFPPVSRKMLPKLITNVCLPPFLACTIIGTASQEELPHMFAGALLPFIVMAILFGGAWIFARMIRVKQNHFGLFCACFSNPNSIFIGIPVNQALFGPQALPYVLVYYFASTIFFWTVGNYCISRDLRESPEIARQPGGIHWQQILSPPMLGVLCGIGILSTGWKIPDFLWRPATLVGDMSTPLALIFIGITLQEIGLRKPDRDMIWALTGRMLISPSLMLFCVSLVSLPELMGKVFVLQSSLPVLMQVAILSAYYGTDAKFGAMMVALSTILSVITIPLWMTLL